MNKFDKLSGIAAPMPMVNIDTDMIIPKQFLKTIKRSGLGVNLFDEMRYDRDGNEVPDFVLNKPVHKVNGVAVLTPSPCSDCSSPRERPCTKSELTLRPRCQALEPNSAILTEQSM